MTLSQVAFVLETSLSNPHAPDQCMWLLLPQARLWAVGSVEPSHRTGPKCKAQTSSSGFYSIMIKEDHFACETTRMLEARLADTPYTGGADATGLVHTLAASDYSIAKELR